MLHLVSANLPPGCRKIDGTKLEQPSGIGLDTVTGTAAGLLGSVQGLWTKNSSSSSGATQILDAVFVDIAFDARQPLLRTPSLVLAHSNGFQVWDLSRAHQSRHGVREAVSKHFPVAISNIACVQLFDRSGRLDAFSSERPFLAFATQADSFADLHPGYLHLYSLKKGIIRQVALQNPNRERITQIESNDGWIAVGTTYGRIYLISSETLKLVHVIEAWADQDDRAIGGSSTGANSSRPTFTLGSRWLAFQTRSRLDEELDSSISIAPTHTVSSGETSNSPDRSASGRQHSVSSSSSSSSESSRSGSGAWTTSSISAMGYAGMREAVYYTAQIWNNLSTTKSSPPRNPPSTSPSNSSRSSSPYPAGQHTIDSRNSNSPGIQTSPGTVEICRLSQQRLSRMGIFAADSRHIESMSFDPSGILLATSSDGGQEVKIWNAAEILSFSGPRRSSAAPKYVLQRGATLGSIRGMTWTDDSTYIAFTSQPKGTTHIFPISLSGEEVNASTHLPLTKASSMGMSNVSSPRGSEPSPATPAKAAIVHSPASQNSKFSGVSRISPILLSTERSDQDISDHAGDLSLLSIYPNGSLRRTDLSPGVASTASTFSLSMLSLSSAPTSPTQKADSHARDTSSASADSNLVLNSQPQREWMLPAPTAEAQRPTFAHSANSNWFSEEYGALANSGEAPPEQPKEKISSADLLAQVDVQTHDIEASENVWGPTFAMYGYSDPNEAEGSQLMQSSWWDDSKFERMRRGAVNLRPTVNVRQKNTIIGFGELNKPTGARSRPSSKRS